MSGRPSDPNTRRLKRFVMLVIFAVTLPSLLMSGFGLIAIDNEEDAALRRVKKLYQPVVQKLAQWLQSQLKATLADSDRPLGELTGWAKGQTPEPTAAMGRLRRLRDSMANFFVIGKDGAVLFPRPDSPATAWHGYLPEMFDQGLRVEHADNDPRAAVAVYQALLGELGGESARCLAMRSVRVGLGPRDEDMPEECRREVAEADLPVRCQVRNALARSLDRSGQEKAALAEWARLAERCPDFVTASGYNLALGARLRRLELLWPTDVDRARVEAEALGAMLSDPLVSASADQVRFVAERAATHLQGGRAEHMSGLVDLFDRIARNETLFAALPDLGRSIKEGVELRSVEGRRGRRLVVVRKGDEALAGFEVVPGMLEPRLQAYLEEMDVGLDAVVRIRPPTEPLPASSAGLLAGSVVLTDGQFAWRLDLTLKDNKGLGELTRSRAQLYLWLLVLLVLVLALGIAGTVWVMVRETRLSRLKTDFVSSVSHELRTPLTSIRLFSETLLLGRARDDAERQEFLEIIAKESERLSRLVERILDFSRMEADRKAYSPQAVEVRGLIESATNACGSLVQERKARVVLRLDADLPQVPVDRDAMVEVLINLLANALKYGPAGQDVIVGARVSHGSLELSVTDQGIGISRTEQSRIFDKFYRVETPLTSEVSGSGLGLSLVRYIVEGHGGEVLVDSAPGKGSTFTVRLPLKHSGKGN